MLNCCYWVLPKVGQSCKVVRVVLFYDCIILEFVLGGIYITPKGYISPLSFFASFFLFFKVVLVLVICYFK